MDTILPILTAVWQFCCAHEIVFWIAASLVINLALRARSTEQWIARCDKYPRLASVIRLLRAIGVDPVKLVESGIAVVNGKARVDILPPSNQATNQASVAPKDAEKP